MILKKIAMSVFFGCSFFCLQADFDPQRDILVSTSPNLPREGQGGKIQVWDPLTLEQALEFDYQAKASVEDPFHLAYFYDPASSSYKILTNIGRNFAIYTPGSDEVITSAQPASDLINTFAVVQANTAAFILVGDRAGYVSEYRSDGSFIRRFDKNQGQEGTYGITCFGMYNNASKQPKLVTGSCDGTVYIRDFISGDYEAYFSTGQSVTSLVIFNDDMGTNIIAATSGLFEEGQPVGQLVCWNVNSKTETYRVNYDSSGYNIDHQGQMQWGFINGLMLIHDQNSNFPITVTIANDSTIKLWCGGSCFESLQYNPENQDTYPWVMDVKPFKKNGVLYLVAAYYNGDVLFWNTKTGKCEGQSSLGQSKEERTLPRAIVIFERDQKLYASASGDSQNICTWSLDNYALVKQVQGNNNTEWCLATNQQIFGNLLNVTISHDSSPGLGYRVPIFTLPELNTMNLIKKSSCFIS